MQSKDIDKVVAFYIDYYNNDGGCWTRETAFKRINQIFTRQDSYCILLENEEQITGIAIGYFTQYDDIVVYDLVEIVVAAEFQNKGIGTQIMLEIECRLKKAGASLIQPTAVNDEMHEHFYGKLGYKKSTKIISMSKSIG